jgi:hypothetical protein
VVTPWDPDPSLPAINKSLDATVVFPEVTGVSSLTASGLGLVFSSGFEPQPLTGCSFENVASRLAWDGGPWDATRTPSPFYVPGTPIGNTQNFQPFIGLNTLTGVFGRFFNGAQISNGTFGDLDPILCPFSYSSWVEIGDVMRKRQ